MDGRTRYKKIKNMLSKHIGKEMRLSQLQRLIMINIGTSEKIVREVSRFMIDLGLVVEIDHLVFRIVETNDDDLISDESFEENASIETYENL